MSGWNAWGGGGEFSCRHCSAFPRHPCQSAGEVAECPNADAQMRQAARRDLPGYDREAADELAEYRRRYGPLRPSATSARRR